MGSHISLATLIEYWPLIALPAFLLSITFFLGELIVSIFDEPAYVIPGMVFNNVIAMPLLLTQAISNSNVLEPLLLPGESIDQAVTRAKAYILLHGIVHNISRFAFGPIMLKKSTKPDVVRRMTITIANKIHHVIPSKNIDQEEQETERVLPSNENSSLFDPNYSLSSIQYGSTAQPDSDANDPGSSLMIRAKSSPNMVNSYQVAEDNPKAAGQNSFSSPSSSLAQARHPHSQSFTAFDRPHFGSSQNPELQARHQYYYQRARQLSRKSVDFDETRALLPYYFDKAASADAAHQDKLRHLRKSKKHHHHHSAKHDIHTHPPSIIVTDGHEIQPSISSIAEDQNVTPLTFNDSQLLQTTNLQDSPGYISSGDSSLDPTVEEAYAERDAEAHKSAYDILPQWLTTFIKSHTPAPDSRIYKTYQHVSQYLNPAVVSGIVATIIGITPCLHWFFFQFSVIKTSFTPSINSIGELYPALQLFALGSKLTKPPETPPRKSTIFWISISRYLVIPSLGLAVVWCMINYAPKSVWPQNKMLNFILMIVPAGPPAITLAAVAEIAGVADREISAISRMLVYLYAMAPLVAPTVAIALSIAYTIE